MKNRQLKDLLYEQVARIGKALASPKRLEMLEVLAQAEKTVEALSTELAIDVKLASAHLRTLREARLVQTRRDGKYIYYRISGPDVAGLWVNLREVAEENLVELRMAVDQMIADPGKLSKVDGKSLMHKAKQGEVVVIDVRPQEEYDTAHLPFARSMPLDELAKRLAELPKRQEIVAYCRGPFCLLSDEAVKLLQARGYKARKILQGVSEWHAAGLPLER
ncbi:MAG TPA: metalloregulator ArsR/SmtB family transcription factor [Ramlibacter sp.]|jgi:rhodanese-related sulfurtransferase|nr:metalloregulator ArsR/SmtB family transcription factor [Ramlibacter sp.]